MSAKPYCNLVREEIADSTMHNWPHVIDEIVKPLGDIASAVQQATAIWGYATPSASLSQATR